MGSATTDPEASRGRFMALDGLRGVAALAVFALHLPPLAGFVTHAYLAVDLFFIISGFVVAHAYEARLRAGWSLGGFVRTRVIRLWPLYLLGTAVGVWAFAGSAGDAAGFAALGVLLAAALVMLPVPMGAELQVFPLNPPAWSLFFEMAANILYAAFAGRLTNRILMAVVGLGAVAVIAAFLAFGTGAVGQHGASLVAGSARIAFAFPLGVLLHRFWSEGRLIPRLPLWAAALLFAAVVAMPDLGAWNGAFDAAAVLLVLPVVAATAAAARLSPRAGGVAALLALVSYPLYILHGPVIIAFREALGPTPLAWTLGGTVSLVGAYAAARWFDAPARAVLARMMGQRRPQAMTA